MYTRIYGQQQLGEVCTREPTRLTGGTERRNCHMGAYQGSLYVGMVLTHIIKHINTLTHHNFS